MFISKEKLKSIENRIESLESQIKNLEKETRIPTGTYYPYWSKYLTVRELLLDLFDYLGVKITKIESVSEKFIIAKRIISKKDKQ